MVNCEPQSVKKVLEILTREPFMYREAQISDVIKLRGPIYSNLSFVNIKYYLLCISVNKTISVLIFNYQHITI